MTPATIAKCAHPVCCCLTTSGKYCSRQCEAMQKTPDIDCSCAHMVCTGGMRSISSSRIEAPVRTHHRSSMRKLGLSFAILSLFAFGGMAGCFHSATKSPDVADNIRKSFDEAGYKNLSVSQDRDKGVVTLSGTVTSEGDKERAESIAKSYAGSQVVADQIAVVPTGIEKEARAINSDLDTGIEKNLDAAIIQNRMHDNVKYDVKSGVVTLSGEVNSQSLREHAAKVAAAVPNVRQVVNDLQVRSQKASST